jgi:NTE family protein
VTTFSDLKIDQSDDPDMSLPPERRYGLVVHTSDITRAQLVRLPWDYNYCGLPRDDQDVVTAVRASMSIPFFFEPVTTGARAADIEVPMPDGSRIQQHYDAGTVTWADGSMPENFPISAFDREDGGSARSPTIGIKLSSLQTSFPATLACSTALGVAIGTLRTLTNEWDRYDADQTTAARTIFVDNAGLPLPSLILPRLSRISCTSNGVEAATSFIIEMSKADGVPRDAEQARQFVRTRQAAADR